MIGIVAKSKWIPLLEYATKNSVSISTLRRKIKKRSIPFRQEGGRYLLLGNELPVVTENVSKAVDVSAAIQAEKELLQSQMGALQTELRSAQNEIAELKTLVAVYEETFDKNSSIGG